MAVNAVLPSPSGQHPVGCAHLMHKFEDDTDTLLVRLFYPCQEGGGRRPYTQWVPHERYVKGYNEYWKFMLPESGISTGELFSHTSFSQNQTRSSWAWPDRSLGREVGLQAYLGFVLLHCYYFQVGVNRLDHLAKPQHSELQFCKEAATTVVSEQIQDICLQPDLLS